MNKIIIFILLIYSSNLYSQRFITKDAEISFFSEAPIEDISAKNYKVSAVYDLKTNQLVFQLNISDFIFPKPLMQEHFNENYVESDIYPKATFKGNIIDFDKISATETPVKIIGEITIHGESQKITIEAIAKKTQVAVFMTGDFYINLADFAVDIPSIVRNKIAQKIKVSFRFNHKPYK